MTPEQVRAKSKEKADKIKAFLAELQVTIVPTQRINHEMYLEFVIVFRDEENYPLVTREPELIIPENEKQNVKSTDL